MARGDGADEGSESERRVGRAVDDDNRMVIPRTASACTSTGVCIDVRFVANYILTLRYWQQHHSIWLRTHTYASMYYFTSRCIITAVTSTEYYT